MKDPKVYRVTPDSDKSWRLGADGNERATGYFDTKDEAIRRGRELAKKEEGQLFIHGLDGRIQQERTYHKDPYPPKG